MNSVLSSLPPVLVALVLQFAASSPRWLLVSKRTKTVVARSVWVGCTRQICPGLLPAGGELASGLHCRLLRAPNSWIGPTCYLDRARSSSGEVIVGKDTYGRGFFVCQIRETRSARKFTLCMFQRYVDADRLWCFAGKHRPPHTVVSTDDVAEIQLLLQGKKTRNFNVVGRAGPFELCR